VYLKRLELYGFKTFADRTDLEFGPGITAIVGPNGSGKSNLADAILWCLGEQSFKSLRSGSSQDIIFAGSEGRRRSGVGEVSVTLDNSDGALRLDFSEITITRRVFRAGEGEYFINRVPCRLRDIHELLLDTGIGKNAYAMISQTEVDHLLSVRSEDRREIFEQAAGIQRYRQRKEETRRKLDRVCANLIRVNDIIHELEVQIGPLSQQCEAAREYRRLSKELYDLKLSLLVSDHRALSESLARARERERELEQELESARTRLHQLAAQEAELRAQLQAAEERLEETRGLVIRLSSEADRGEGRLNLTTQRIEDLEQQAATAAQEMAQLEQQKAAAEGELAAAQEQRPALEARGRELEAEVIALERQLKEESGSLRTADQSAEEQRAGHLDSLRELADARNRLVQCESMLQAAQSRIARIAEQQTGIDARRQGAEQRAAAAAGAAAELRARRSQLEAEIYSLRSEEDAAHAAAEACEKQELALRERLSEVRARHQALQEMEHARDGLRAGVRAVLAAVAAGQLPGGYHMLADLVRVPKELEAAIESALGPAAGDLVVETPERAAAAIALLRETRAGRATFLPRSTIRPAARPDALHELAQRPGCFGIAADLVSCDPGVAPIFEHLLGRVLIAEDMDAALSLGRDSHGWRAIVTRDGDAIRPWGAITGGSPAPSSHLLGRAREIEELQAEQASLAAALERVATDVEEARQRGQTAASAADVRRREVEDLLASLAESERTAEVLAESARGERERWEALAAERDALEAEVAQTQEERAAASARVEELAEKQQAAHSAVEGLHEALRSGQEARERLSATASERRVSLTAVEGDRRTLDARVEKIAQNIGVLSRAMADKQALITRLTESQQQARAAQEDLRRECENLREHHRRAQEEETRVRDHRQAVLDQLAANRETDAQTREEIESFQTRIHRSQLRTTQLDSEIGFTERTLLDEYRIALEQAEQMAAPIESRTAAQTKVKDLQAQVDALGEVNVGAIEEYERVRQRLESFTTQRADLEAARADLEQVMIEADREATSRFLTAFELLRNHFRELFTRLFEGGEADLLLTDPENVLECGVDVSVTLPGKKTRDLLQLSGGERALTAAALLFSLLTVKPSPFVILDEVDAPLDDSNVGRYCEVLREFAQRSQFIVITHNKGTMESADTLYGVTMEEAGVSRLIGVRLREPSDQSALTQPSARAPQEEPAPEESAIVRKAA
jgi:chromosome segregation protein